MSDTNLPIGDDDNGLRVDAGNPSSDRSHLIDAPPAQLDEETIQENADSDGAGDEGDQPGDIADAARD